MLHVSGEKVKVHFRDDPERREYRTISTALVPLDIAPIQSDPVLDNLPPFDGDRFQVSAKRVTIEDGIERFRQLFPRGFADADYIGTGKLGENEFGERAYKWNAHERYRELVAAAGPSLLAANEFEELIRRATLVVSQNLNLLSRFENMAFRDGLHGDENAARRFFESLFDLTAAPGVDEQLFTRLLDSVTALPVERGKSRVATWPVATLLPALADPTRFIFLKPESTQECAERVRFDIQYSAELRWITYRKVLDMAAMLLDRLRPLGAQDFIDVQSFMWVIARH